MLSSLPHHLYDMPIYKKALDIFTLSQNISEYLNHDLSDLNQDGSEKKGIYFSGDIVMQSTSLAPEILKAELEQCSDRRHKHAARVRIMTNLLYRNSYRLEKCDSNGKEFLPLLRRELKKFRKMQRHWMMTL